MAYERRPGKFESSGAIGELFFAIAGEGFSDGEVGSPDWGESALKFDGPFECKKLAESWPVEVSQLGQEECEDLERAAGAILYNASSGSVDVDLFESAKKFEQHWEKLEAEYSVEEEEGEEFEEEEGEEFEENARLNEAEKFFYEHSGYMGPAGGSAAEKRAARRTHAKELASAEQAIETRGWQVVWEEDPEGWDTLGDVDPEEVEEVLWAALKDEHGDVLASLGGNAFGFDTPSNRQYRRLIEAELALEALSGSHQANKRRPGTVSKLRKLTREHRGAKRPEFDPARPSPRETKRHHFAVNGAQELFMEELRSQLELQDRQISIRLQTSGSVSVNFINLPSGVGSAGGGAEAENNRMMFWISGFESPTGKIQLKQSVSALPRNYSLRGKTGTPSQIAKYLADFLNRVVREVSPRFTHTSPEATIDEWAARKRSSAYNRNARRDAPDEHAARELELYIDNDIRFAPGSPEGIGRAVVINQLRKWKKGTYDPKLGPKAWAYVVESAAKAYDPGWSRIFTPATRDMVAEDMARDFERSAAAGEYDHIDTKVGAR